MRAKVNGSYFPGHGTLVEKMFLEGKARGQAESILRVLAARDIRIPEPAAQRIIDCTNLKTLDRWLDRMMTATAAEVLFAAAEWAAGREEGLARGRSASILHVLDSRGIHVHEPTAQRITDCTDLKTLDHWLDRAIIVSNVKYLFDEEGATAAPEAAK